MRRFSVWVLPGTLACAATGLPRTSSQMPDVTGTNAGRDWYNSSKSTCKIVFTWHLRLRCDWLATHLESGRCHGSGRHHESGHLLFHQKSTCLTQLTSRPCVVQIGHVAVENSTQRDPRTPPSISRQRQLFRRILFRSKRFQYR